MIVEKILGESQAGEKQQKKKDFGFTRHERSLHHGKRQAHIKAPVDKNAVLKTNISFHAYKIKRQVTAPTGLPFQNNSSVGMIPGLVISEARMRAVYPVLYYKKKGAGNDASACPVREEGGMMAVMLLTFALLLLFDPAPVEKASTIASTTGFPDPFEMPQHLTLPAEPDAFQPAAAV